MDQKNIDTDYLASTTLITQPPNCSYFWHEETVVSIAVEL